MTSNTLPEPGVVIDRSMGPAYDIDYAIIEYAVRMYGLDTVDINAMHDDLTAVIEGKALDAEHTILDTLRIVAEDTVDWLNEQQSRLCYYVEDNSLYCHENVDPQNIVIHDISSTSPLSSVTGGRVTFSLPTSSDIEYVYEEWWTDNYSEQSIEARGMHDYDVASRWGDENYEHVLETCLRLVSEHRGRMENADREITESIIDEVQHGMFDL